jgi:hypothetical protein
MKNLFTQNNKKQLNINDSPKNEDHLMNEQTKIVLKEYIVHFANFNIDVSISMDIIVEFSTIYNYEKERVSLYISLLNSNLYTIKNKSFFELIDFDSLFFKREFRKYLRVFDSVLSTVSYSLKYLNNTDYMNLLCLNKNYKMKLSKIIYKNIFTKYHYMDNNIRLKLWSNILNNVFINN